MREKSNARGRGRWRARRAPLGLGAAAQDVADGLLLLLGVEGGRRPGGHGRASDRGFPARSRASPIRQPPERLGARRQGASTPRGAPAFRRCDSSDLARTRARRPTASPRPRAPERAASAPARAKASTRARANGAGALSAKKYSNATRARARPAPSFFPERDARASPRSLVERTRAGVRTRAGSGGVRRGGGRDRPARTFVGSERRRGEQRGRVPRLNFKAARRRRCKRAGDPRPMRRIRDEPSRDETVCSYGRARKRSLERPSRDAQPVRGFLTSGHRGFDAALLVAARRRRKVSHPFPRSPPRARSFAAARGIRPRLRPPDPRFALAPRR
jgi:hypothetical protein